MDKSKVKKTYYINKEFAKKIEELSEGNMTKVVNELLGFALFCTGEMIRNNLDLEDIEKIFRSGLNVHIKNRRNNS